MQSPPLHEICFTVGESHVQTERSDDMQNVCVPLQAAVMVSAMHACVWMCMPVGGCGAGMCMDGCGARGCAVWMHAHGCACLDLRGLWVLAGACLCSRMHTCIVGTNSFTWWARKVDLAGV